MSNAKKLKTVDDWKKVFITPYLDKQERLRNKELREELWRRRKDLKRKSNYSQRENCKTKRSPL